MADRNAHCSYCGTRFAEGAPWPRECAACRNTSYLNPFPVAVIILPVDGGILCVRRNIEPRRGELALPGGYIGLGESWQEAAARELFEETGIRIRASDVKDHITRSTPEGRQVIVFGIGPALSSSSLPAFTPNDETQERVIIDGPRELAFSTHTEALQLYWQRR